MGSPVCDEKGMKIALATTRTRCIRGKCQAEGLDMPYFVSAQYFLSSGGEHDVPLRFSDHGPNDAGLQ